MVEKTQEKDDLDKARLVQAKNDMLEYIMNMIEFICSGDHQEDMRNMKLLAQSILERSQELFRAQQAKKKCKEKEEKRKAMLKLKD